MTADSLSEEGRKLRRIVHKTIGKVTGDIEERFHFNTAIAAVMELVNSIFAFEPKNHPANAPVLKEAGQKVLSSFWSRLCLISVKRLWESLATRGG